MSQTTAGNEVFIEINRRWCKACGICIEFCPKQVLDWDEDGKPYAAHAERCSACRLCELRCPDFALEVRGEQNGA